MQYKNGATTTYEYDAFTFRVRNIKTIRGSDSKVLQDLQYWYDPIGNITLQKDGAQQPVYFDGTVADPQNDYTYDALYRLIQAEGRELAGNNNAPTYNDSSRMGITPIPIAATDTAKMRRYTEAYTYDKAGNMLTQQHTVTGGTGNWTRNYTTDNNSNRLMSTVVGSGTPESYAYDNRGNIVSGFSHLQSMSYNADNRLEKLVINSTRTAYYQYDANGQRVRKTIVDTNSNTTEIRKYVGEWEVYRKLAGSSLNIERETLHISDDTGRIALIDTRTQGTGAEPLQLLRYQYSNHLGSATLELDYAGAIISYEEYYPYGSTSFQSGRSLTEVSLKRYRYTGKERDEESGLYYHGARYYIPWLARWTAVDPLESKYAGRTPYCYGADNPIIFNDPSGNQEENDNDKKGIWYAEKFGTSFKWNPSLSINEFKEKNKDNKEASAFREDQMDFGEGTNYHQHLNYTSTGKLIVTIIDDTKGKIKSETTKDYNPVKKHIGKKIETKRTAEKEEKTTTKEQDNNPSTIPIIIDTRLKPKEQATKYYSSVSLPSLVTPKQKNIVAPIPVSPAQQSTKRNGEKSNVLGIAFKVNDYFDQAMTLTDANMQGAQKLANVASETTDEITKLAKIPVLGFVAQASGALTIFSNTIEAAQEWEKGNIGTAIWKGTEAAATTIFLLGGGEEIELFWNLGTMLIDDYREFFK